MCSKAHILHDLNQRLADVGLPQPKAELGSQGHLSFGCLCIDDVVGHSLPKSALHEVYALSQADSAAATCFTTAVLVRALSCQQMVVWVRERRSDWDWGQLYAQGLWELGLDPGRIIQVSVKDTLSVLRAAHDALKCPAVGAVVLEPWGRAYDLVASRRLMLAAHSSGVLALMLGRGEAVPSSAHSRWGVRSASAKPMAVNSPGFPTFEMNLLRHRAGLPPARWTVEWNRDDRHFNTLAPVSGHLVSDPAHRQVADIIPFQRTG
jgi:protein ImuA